MRRSGFTMVELIFVIVILGVLATMAVPKFGDIRDRAKINSEVASLSSLDGVITAAIEFQREDYDNMKVDWHEAGADSTSNNSTYSDINTINQVLKKIIKKGEDLTIKAYNDWNVDGNGTDTIIAYDVLFIEGAASSSTSGAAQKDSGDISGKPDTNDFWVFNSSAVDVNISGTNISETTIQSGEMKLMDATDEITYGGLTVKKASDGTNSGNPTAL